MDQTLNISEQNFSLFGSGSKINGSFTLRGKTYLSSEVEGEIIVENNHMLSIERDGRVKGRIRCFNLEIHGSVEGEIESLGRVTIYPSGSFIGRLNASSLSVHPGASVDMEGHTLE